MPQRHQMERQRAEARAQAPAVADTEPEAAVDMPGPVLAPVCEMIGHDTAICGERPEQLSAEQRIADPEAVLSRAHTSTFASV